MPLPVTFYTRRDCPLCDKAKAAIQASGAEFDLVEVDVDGDPELKSRFANDVPIVYVNGVEAFRHFVHPQEFASYVRNAPKLPREALDEGEIAALLPHLQPGWTYHDRHELRRELKFKDFAAALAFANRIGAIAEELGHHPDILVGWGRAVVTSWTHDSGGVTRTDFILAARIDHAVSS